MDDFSSSLSSLGLDTDLGHGFGRTGIVELRQYTLHPGARETLIELFEREFVGGQQAVGIAVGGRFRDLDDPDRFVWLRAFPDMAHRRRALEAFYYGPVWRAHRDVANATMVDSDNVLLLRGPGFTVPSGTGEVTATICHPSDETAFDAYAAQHLTPGHALHRTEHAENDFPALPVRTGEEVRVWFGGAEPAPWPSQRLRLEPVSTLPS
ncbi:NIPSNAP family protein [Streptacidiphilus jiangxiensis]|uniref:NIPSNAP protein n=1 Tax=Streptacidiphilus jiangxiensis TaxID=235985 RepID=A0A1H7R2S2_STRJI|nr:NIPSNAP family protein [Streptacidiphilus jiangxiensis]SEL54245.1 NIPSNAP protein [Streptacidiphilus jiangxiensis]